MSTFQPWLQPPPSPANGLYGYNPYPYGGWDPNAGKPKLDANGNPVLDASGNPVVTGNGPDTSQMGFTPGGNEVDVDPNASMEQIYAANRDTINTTGNQIGQQAGNQLNYYGPLQQGFQTAQSNALNQLQETPGYTDAESSAIRGNPNAPVQAVDQGVTREQGALDQYGRNLGAQLNQGQGWMGDAAAQYKSGVRNATSGLATGLGDAQGKFAPLDTAVNNPQLGFDPNGTERQMTDQDVQDLITSSGTTVGNQFKTAEDTLERQAAAQGNTSPAAQAALRQQLVTQEAATAGDAMTNARIAALQAQQARAAQIEQQREGATQTQTGFKATAATTEEAAAQAAAAQAGQANIGAEENIGANTQNVANTAAQQNLNAANTYGQFDVGQQTTQTGQQYGSQNTAEQEAASRAGTTANQRIAGQGAYRSGVQGQQQMAQQGGQQAQQTQLGAFGTTTSGENAAASGQSGFEIGKHSLGDAVGSNFATFFSPPKAEGGFSGQDEIATVGESGPEWVGDPHAASNVNSIMKESVRYGGRKKRYEDPEMFGVAA